MKFDSSLVAKLVVIGFVLVTVPVAGADLPVDLAIAAKDYDRATVEGDIAALERIFASEYVLVNSDASVENKQQAIADFRMPGFKIDPYVLMEPVEITWGNAAVIGGVVHLLWTQDGKHQERSIRIAHIWAKRDGNWQMTYTQVTRVPL